MARRDEVPEGIPPKLWFHFSDIWSRQDELMEAMLAVAKRQLEVLERLARITPVPAVVPGLVAVGISKEISQFVGADFQTYGPYKPGEIAWLPKEDAERLIKQRAAVLVPAVAPGLVAVKVLKEISQFVGADFRTYGPYKPGEIAWLPKEDAERLIKQMAAVLVPVVAPVPVPVPAPPVPPAIPVTQETIALLRKIVERPVPEIPTPLEVNFSIKAVERLAAWLIQLPNRLDKIEIETSNKKWASLRKAQKIIPDVALGFWVESVGGGFSYKIVREGHAFKPKTADVDDKWDLEFDDIQVSGSGVAGTAVIWYWWAERL